MSKADPAGLGAIAFVGLGMMGLPMAARLVAAGHAVRGSDISANARSAFAKYGGEVFEPAREAAKGASTVITMLPDGAIVRDVLLGGGAMVEALAPGALVIDMSSSQPLATRALAAELAALDISLVDAPVSGGVKRAADGSLTVMAGGDPGSVERARPLLETMGKAVFVMGPVGSGHAAKALNNFVSAAGLTAACEAALVAEAFGIDPGVLVDVMNVSTGRNNSTELKMKPFILSGNFQSGFSMALMAKDVQTAARLAEQLDIDAEAAQAAAALWEAASLSLGKAADHTEIYRFLANRDRNFG